MKKEILKNLMNRLNKELANLKMCEEWELKNLNEDINILKNQIEDKYNKDLKDTLINLMNEKQNKINQIKATSKIKTLEKEIEALKEATTF